MDNVIITKTWVGPATLRMDAVLAHLNNAMMP